MLDTSKTLLERLGYNADTREHTEYAPMSYYADAHGIAARVQSVFTDVRCVVLEQEQILLCTSCNAQAALSASWFATGISAGAAQPREFRA